MLEKEKLVFMDLSGLTETDGIRSRANVAYLQTELNKCFEDIEVVSVAINESGKFNPHCHPLMRFFGAGPIRGLPPFVDVRLKHRFGTHEENIIVWSPLAWNDRFMGTCGGGTCTGGMSQIIRPDNTSRGQTLPKALINHFSAATCDSGHQGNIWAFDKNGRLDLELIERWRSGGTHAMAVYGKVVTELLHGRKIAYSYIHGGSGGGRQTMTEAQEYPADFDGYWASCPAVYWNHFILMTFWHLAVMNDYRNYLSFEKLNFFLQEARNFEGGDDAFYQICSRSQYDPHESIGKTVGRTSITQADADVMAEIWAGPIDADGTLLHPNFRPGITFHNKIIPIGSIYYPLFSKKPASYAMYRDFARWVTGDAKGEYDNISRKECIKLMKAADEKFPEVLAAKDLSDFRAAGGKLIVDHGTADPLIPVDGILNYYSVCENHFGKDPLRDFFRLYITPGDGHGSCSYHGPGITEADGMRALIDWVEKGKAPEQIRGVKVDSKGNTVRETVRNQFGLY